MRTIWLAGLLFTLAIDQRPAAPRRPAPQTPPPSGQRVLVGDGDVVVADNGARVRLVRRTDANVRAIYNAAEHWLVLLVDGTSADGRAPDGIVDTTYTFNELAGEWPLGERWEGSAFVEDYSMVGEAPVGPHGAGLAAPSGLIQLFSRNGGDTFRDPSAVAVLEYGGIGRSIGSRMTFADAEAHHVAVAARNATGRGPMPGGFRSTIQTSAQQMPGGVVVSPYPAPAAPVRVGGNVRPPVKIVDAKPVMPAAAAQQNVQGVVILEAVIGPDGAVSDVKVLRSIPMLDQAAIDAVRQWRYEPTLLNGVPVPVIMTVTVNF